MFSYFAVLRALLATVHLSCSLIRCLVNSTVAFDALDRPVRADHLYKIACWNHSGSNAKQTNKQTDETQKAFRINK